MALVMGALGTTSKGLRKWLSEIGTMTQITELQNTVVLKTTKIHQKVLEI